MTEPIRVGDRIYYRIGQEYHGNYGGIVRRVVDGVIVESENPDEIGQPFSFADALRSSDTENPQ